MTPLLTLVAWMAIVTWLTLMAASLIRARAWTLGGTILALGNRDNVPLTSALAGRAGRTAQNTLENFVLFAALALIAQAAGMAGPKVLAGAQLFFWARLLYIPVYYAGIPYLRTGVWAASIAGLVMMLSAML
jgi:uncharacterized MAPEG superfamily protein